MASKKRGFRTMQTGQGRSNRPNASSAIANITFQPESLDVSESSPEELGTLVVEFMQGGVYAYSDVPKRVYESMLKSPSMGRYFNFYVRNMYEFEES